MDKNAPDETPRHVTEGKASWLTGHYPSEDVQGTDMFRPFFRRRRTWLVLGGFILLFAVLHGLPLDHQAEAAADLDVRQVRLGLGIFCCIAFLWLTEAMPLYATALLVPVLATLTGVLDLQPALAGFAHPLIFLFFAGFALASALAYQRLDQWIAHRMVQLGRGSFLAVSALLCAVTAGLSMWMSNTATTAMMVPLVLGLLGGRGSSRTPQAHRNAVFLLLGVAYAASIGGIGTIVGSPPNAIAAQQLGLSFEDWLRFGVPSVVILLPLMFVVLWLTCRPDRTTGLEVARQPFAFNWHRRVTLLIFAATAVAWVFSRQISSWTGVSGSLDTVIGLLAVLALLYTRVVRWRDVDRGTDWGVLLLFGGGITLSTILKSSGASLYLARLFTGTVLDWPTLAIVGAVVCFVILLTELSSNTATAALMVPVFYAVALELDLPATRLVIPLTLAASCAFMLPVATPPNAIVFGTGRIPQFTMMRVGLVMNLVYIVALTLLAWILL